MRTVSCILLALIGCTQANSRSGFHDERPAKDILASAFRTASMDQKMVFLIFGRKGCSPCDAFLAVAGKDPWKPIFSRNFEVVYLQLGPPKWGLPGNPGAWPLFEKYCRLPESLLPGTPYYVILDHEGRAIVDSVDRADGRADSLAGFVGLHGRFLIKNLQLANVKITTAEMERIKHWQKNPYADE